VSFSKVLNKSVDPHTGCVRAVTIGLFPCALRDIITYLGRHETTVILTVLMHSSFYSG